MEERPEAREKASHATCSAEELDTPVKGVDDLEQVAPEGEDTNEDGCWTERGRRDTPTGIPWQRVSSDELSTRTA